MDHGRARRAVLYRRCCVRDGAIVDDIASERRWTARAVLDFVDDNTRSRMHGALKGVVQRDKSHGRQGNMAVPRRDQDDQDNQAADRSESEIEEINRMDSDIVVNFKRVVYVINISPDLRSCK